MKVSNLQSKALKEKAATLLKKKVSAIKSVDEHYNGATVHMRSGCMPWINIPLEYWIGEAID